MSIPNWLRLHQVHAIEDRLIHVDMTKVVMVMEPATSSGHWLLDLGSHSHSLVEVREKLKLMNYGIDGERWVITS